MSEMEAHDLEGLAEALRRLASWQDMESRASDTTPEERANDEVSRDLMLEAASILRWASAEIEQLRDQLTPGSRHERAPTTAAYAAACAAVAKHRARADAAEAEIERLKAECFSLAAISCGGFHGGDHGHPQCTLVDTQRARAEAAEALLRACVEAHESGRYEHAQAAYHVARAALGNDDA